MSGDDLAFKMSRGAAEQRDAVTTPGQLQIVESLRIRLGEPTRNRLLVLRENAYADPLRSFDRGIDRRIMRDAGENQGWRKADGCEGADGHAAIASGIVARRQDCDGRGESAENGAKEVGIDQGNSGRE